MAIRNKFLLAGSAAALLGSGYVSTPIHAKPTLVKCVINTGNGCPGHCKQSAQIMSKEECIDAGGVATEISN